MPINFISPITPSAIPILNTLSQPPARQQAGEIKFGASYIREAGDLAIGTLSFVLEPFSRFLMPLFWTISSVYLAEFLALDIVGRLIPRVAEAVRNDWPKTLQDNSSLSRSADNPLDRIKAFGNKIKTF